MIKRFDPVLYQENDEKAKNALKKLFDKSSIYRVEDNSKKRGVDLLVYQGDKHVFNIEVEIKKVWKSSPKTGFPYPNIQFPERKEKYANLDKPTLFVMFNHDLSRYLAVTSEDLKASPKVEVRNKYVFSGEKFFQVPRENVIFDDLNSAIARLTNFGKVLYK